MIYRIVIDIDIIQKWFDLDTWNNFRSKENIKSIEVNIVSSIISLYDIEQIPLQPGPMYLKSKNALLSANDDWSEACITLLDGKEDGLEGALIAAIMTHLSLHQGLMLHSSLIDVDGSGIMFVGPSGIGKTTQAELWMKYRDAIIINGDMALVHEEDGVFRGYGCPWHGSSPYCENRDVLLKGIIVLEQASENTIEKLDGLVLFERMMNNIFIPHWFKPGVESAMETIDHLLTKVPVYLLKCRIDEEAVSMVERVLLK